jgi:hypothetical protein
MANKFGQRIHGFSQAGGESEIRTRGMVEDYFSPSELPHQTHRRSIFFGAQL